MRSTLNVLSSLAVLAILGSSAAVAQATRTWVSGVGDDANPCSRTAPCKTFAGAISKTATGGEINVLDPGGFGAVTITKSITISSEGFEAGILVSGTNGVIINAPSTAVVVLRGLDFEGLGTGLSAIRFLAGGALHVERCRIQDFGNSTNGFGIAMVPTSGNAELYVSDTIIVGNFVAGVQIRPTGSGSVAATLDRVQMNDNTLGFRADAGATSGSIKASLFNSTVAGSTNAGIQAVSTAGFGTSVIHLESVQVANNAGSGLLSSSSLATIRMSNTSVTGNFTGLNPQSGGQIISFGNNSVGGNTSNGAPTSTTPLI